MKTLHFVLKLILLLVFGIISSQAFSQDNSIKAQQILGQWKYKTHIYRNVGRYGQNEVDSIKSTILYFKKDKVYFKDIRFIDTCKFTELTIKTFFDRANKKSSYFEDGPLAIKYSEKQLSSFYRIELDCKQNSFGTFFLNKDTLILNSFGGVTFFFIQLNKN